MPTNNGLSLCNGQALTPAGALEVGDVHVRDGVIAAGATDGAESIDCCGALVLPGIVDVHGDAFERELMPRPGVEIDFNIAMASVEAQLLASGITTAFHGLTISWEPGARSLEAGRRFMDRLEGIRPIMLIDHRVQIRWETFAHHAVDDVCAWLTRKPAPAIAFNDHTSDTMRKVSAGEHKKLEQWAHRAGLTTSQYLALVDEVSTCAPHVPAKIAQVAAAAREAGAVMLSHDDRLVTDREGYRALGAGIAEFPLTRDAAKDAIAHGEPTVLGGPNVIRGGSHTGAVSAQEAIAEGLCTILASDYYYPSLLHAVSRLVKQGGIPFADAWARVSGNPAAAMGLNDRGSIRPGNRADLIVVDFGDVPQVVAVVAAGRLVFQTTARAR